MVGVSIKEKQARELISHNKPRSFCAHKRAYIFRIPICGSGGYREKERPGLAKNAAEPANVKIRHNVAPPMRFFCRSPTRLEFLLFLRDRQDRRKNAVQTFAHTNDAGRCK